ncbi:VOC family protein [Bacillus benzoevorans]|uniref:Catechol 2,3-dioxygenase-like lactoylglutathione lyase family enzyme n=1 Tax=Bacillus benzoevorans TaxID=1456 RepID=A0A7X0LVK8_9BACI|nr:VOC family protein [Bacillus benzoevorans]MBB6444374.1 catechol 2,3-dioxygenase-like lactoylglutathione lyase family enzyme [Bacillus benzoevorans]
MFKSSSVTIIVDDLKKAEYFYVETLGFKVQFQVEGHLVQIEAPGMSIGLLHPREGQDSHHVTSGSVQIGLEVQDLDAVVKLLTSRGVAFHPIIEEATTRIANFTDPEGNPLYLIELKS